nr:hypothetical protein [Acinetobacter baumannii]
MKFIYATKPVQYNLKQNYKDDLSKVVGLLNITTLERSELKELGTKNKEIEKIIEKNQKNVALHWLCCTNRRKVELF